MSKVSDQLKQLLEPVITGLGYELVGIEWTADPKQRRVLRIYIDIEDGVTVDDCELVSGQISALLDVEDPIPGNYVLEVSSPGLDRPLFTLAHFRRFIGEPVRIHLQQPLEGRKRFKGTIKAIHDNQVTLVSQEGETVDIPFEWIEKARLVPDYNAILKG
ncbi:MAG: ribosome maturation factor RimP [Methylothermaceae bacteria B42]|nr:MAG: ribosome maturation factor RimP [Methylothermaceae bacteria B42]HHJ37939.1 ribosome maturation factor RimP [Methylothermaceae bacterium]